MGDKNKVYLEKIIEEIKEKLKALSIESISSYDMKDEFKDIDVYKRELEEILGTEPTNSELEKITIYKYFAKKYSKVDCDVSLKSVIIYTLAFDYIGEGATINQQDSSKYKYQINVNKENYKGVDKYLGDTMTSYWTTLKAYIQKKAPKGKIEKKTDEFILDSDGYVPKEDRPHGWHKYILENLERFENLIDECEFKDEINKFLELNHSTGNQIPVPKYFNTGRSKNPNNKKYNAEWDYWDLTLKAIYNYYNPEKSNEDNETGKGDKALVYLLKKTEAVDKCKEWLDSFGSWEEFINKNYLQDFVECDEGKDIFKGPKMFWEKHSFSEPIPKTDKQFEAFFKNVNEMIESRGVRIAKKLKEVL